MLKVINVVGARPNFMKVAPIAAAMKQRGSEFQPFMAHTGQHYDASMSDAFFEDLDMPRPDMYLGVGSGSHAVQTARSAQNVGSTWRTGEVGTNIIAGTDPAMIIEAAKCALKNPVDKSGLRTPELWDGHAAERILDTSIEAEQ